MLKHHKFFLCDFPGCKRSAQGFGTINDLERHKKSVHGMRPTHGSTKSWVCASEDCQGKNKRWPRYDNFKQHVVRLHPKENMEELITRYFKTLHLAFNMTYVLSDLKSTRLI
jgi:hypothetical protein